MEAKRNKALCVLATKKGRASFLSAPDSFRAGLLGKYTKPSMPTDTTDAAPPQKPDDRSSQLALLQNPEVVRAAAVGPGKSQTFGRRLDVGAEKPLWNKASPTGFEPVLPT